MLYKDPLIIVQELTNKIILLKKLKGKYVKLSEKDLIELGWIQYNNPPLFKDHYSFQEIRQLLLAPSGVSYVELGGVVGFNNNNELVFIKQDISHLDISKNHTFKPYVKFESEGNIKWHLHPWNINDGVISIFSKGDFFNAINNPGKVFVLFVPDLYNNYNYPTEYIYTFVPGSQIQKQINAIEYLQEDIEKKINDTKNVPGMPIFIDWSNVISFLQEHGMIMEINLHQNQTTFEEKFQNMHNFVFKNKS